MKFIHLKQLLSKRGNKADLSKAIGVSTGNISDWLGNKRTSNPGMENLCKMADYFNCSVDYLLDRTENKNINSYIYKFPVYEDQQAAAGVGIYGRDGDFEMEDINTDDIPNRAIFGIRINGDSMYPEIPNNSIVLLDPKISIEDCINKNIVASINGEVICKHFTIENQSYCFKSLNRNEKDKDRILQGNNFKIVGEVVKVIKMYE